MCSLEHEKLLQLDHVTPNYLKWFAVADPLVLQDDWIITIAPPVCL